MGFKNSSQNNRCQEDNAHVNDFFLETDNNFENPLPDDRVEAHRLDGSLSAAER